MGRNEIDVVNTFDQGQKWLLQPNHRIREAKISLQTKHLKKLSNFTVKLNYGEVSEAKLHR